MEQVTPEQVWVVHVLSGRHKVTMKCDICWSGGDARRRCADVAPVIAVCATSELVLLGVISGGCRPLLSFGDDGAAGGICLGEGGAVWPAACCFGGGRRRLG